MRRDQPASRGGKRQLRARSPHAQGSTVSARGTVKNRKAFPACAGINRKGRPTKRPRYCVPRMRRDQPQASRSGFACSARSPHAQGSTGRLPAMRRRMTAFPACAGINRKDDLMAQGFLDAFPACAGINRHPDPDAGSVLGVPRMRRDQPMKESPS